MISKIYDKTIKFIKENIYLILIYIAIFFISTYQLPYIILTGGGIIDTNERIEIKEGYKAKGSLNLAYVREIKATIPTFIIGLLNSNWETIKTKDMVLTENETIEDVYTRDKLYLDYGNELAIRHAYKLANKEFIEEYKFINVILISEFSKTNLKIGDVIISVDKEKVYDIDDFKNIVATKKKGDKLELVVKRGDKNINCYTEVIKIDNLLKTGIGVLETSNYKTKPKIKLNFKNGESGPSGGLMMTLSIYNKLVKEDITKGLKIVGTGTIEEDGKVGEIGGIKYKLAGAVKQKADIFIAPSGDNYKEVMKIKKEKKLKIKIIEAKNISEVIKELQNM